MVRLARGVNDEEIGEILQFALAQEAVRGGTLQPVQVADRLDGFDAGTQRLTLSEVRLIPFDTYNLVYRDDLERSRLALLRAGVR